LSTNYSAPSTTDSLRENKLLIYAKINEGKTHVKNIARSGIDKYNSQSLKPINEEVAMQRWLRTCTLRPIGEIDSLLFSPIDVARLDILCYGNGKSPKAMLVKSTFKLF
jgi:hypothetical protein